MAERTIFLSVRPVRKEGIADSAIKPGHLVKRASDGKFDVHGVAGGVAQAAFAFEQELVNGADVDTAYAQNDRLYYGVCSPGALVYAWLPANASAVVIGDYLESNGDGTLRKHVPQTDTDGTGTPAIRTGQIIAMATEAIDNSSGGSPVRIIAEVL